MPGYKIKTDTSYTIESPSIVINPAPPLGVSSDQTLVRNSVTGNIEYVVDTNTLLNNIDPYISILANPGSSNSHDFKTIQSSDASINIIDNTTNLDLKSVNIYNANGTILNTTRQATLTNSILDIIGDNVASQVEILNMNNIVLGSNNINIQNPPSINISSTDLLARNSVNGNLEIMPIGSFPSSVNIYNSDGNLTGNRLVDIGSNSLNFLGGAPGPSTFGVSVSNVNIEGSDGAVLFGVNTLDIKSNHNTTIYGADSTTIGNVSNFGNVTIHAGLNGNLLIDQLSNNSDSNILYYNSGTNKVTYSTPPASSVNITNIGTGSGIISNPSIGSGPFNFKGILAGTGVSLTDLGTDIQINANEPNSNLNNVGAGVSILIDTGSLPVSNNRTFKTLIAGSNITLTPSGSDITISSVSSNALIGFVDYRLDSTITNPSAGATGIVLAPLTASLFGNLSPNSFLDPLIGRINVNPNKTYSYNIQVKFTNPDASNATPDTCDIYISDIPNSQVGLKQDVIITDSNKHLVSNSGSFYTGSITEMYIYFRHSLPSATSSILFSDVTLNINQLD